MIETSEFYQKLNILEAARQTGVNNLNIRGVRCSQNASLPSIVSKILDVPTKSINMAHTTIQANGSVVIVAAELPNTTLTLKDGLGEIVGVKTTDTILGGVVYFETEITEPTLFTMVATNSDGVEIWTNTIYVNNIGFYNCKTGKAFADYTEAEVNIAGKNHYAKYMWSVGDSRTIATVGKDKKWVIAAFDHFDLADGDGKAGITMIMQSYTNASYKHYNSNVNNIGWEGSLIRQNGLKTGDVYYVRATVNGSSNGLYYTYDDENNEWIQHTLPEEYDANEAYYTQNVMASDGAFITGLPDWAPYMVRVITKTADAGSGYKKIIQSKDYVYLPSDAEVFGNSNRYSSKYSQYELEGEQLEYFKNNWQDGKVALGYSCWLRSPSSGTATTFCCVYNYGYINYNSASNGNYARLAFNI